jgi:hypothetical protein
MSLIRPSTLSAKFCGGPSRLCLEQSYPYQGHSTLVTPSTSLAAVECRSAGLAFSLLAIISAGEGHRAEIVQNTGQRRMRCKIARSASVWIVCGRVRRGRQRSLLRSGRPRFWDDAMTPLSGFPASEVTRVSLAVQRKRSVETAPRARRWDGGVKASNLGETWPVVHSRMSQTVSAWSSHASCEATRETDACLVATRGVEFAESGLHPPQ